jgi:hypothetical protein
LAENRAERCSSAWVDSSAASARERWRALTAESMAIFSTGRESRAASRWLEPRTAEEEERSGAEDLPAQAVLLRHRVIERIQEKLVRHRVERTGVQRLAEE